MRLLGLDYGDKKIGLAFGDTEAGLALPLEVVRNVGVPTLAAIAAKVKKEDIDCLVVGVPLKVGGHHGPQQLDKTRAFIAALQEKVAVPVMEEDESYTTAESLRLQREEGSEAEEDALAAMLILQSYMDQARPRV